MRLYMLISSLFMDSELVVLLHIYIQEINPARLELIG